MPLFGPPDIEKLKARGDIGGLVKALGHKDADTRRKAAAALGDLGDPHAVTALVTALSADEKDVREAALGALRALSGPLVASLKDENSDVRRQVPDALWAYVALGLLDQGVVVELLINALHDEHWFVRFEAAKALRKLNDPRSLEPLIVALKDDNSAVRLAVAAAVGQLGEVAVEPLVAALGEEDWGVRAAAAQALGLLGDPRAVQPLIAVLDDLHPTVRASATVALAEFSDPRAVEAITAARNKVMDEHESVLAAGYRTVMETLKAERARTRRVQAVLVLSLRPLHNAQALIQQIVDQQRSKGYSTAPDFIASVRVAADSLEDKAYIYAALRTEFSNLGGHDLIERTVEFPFQASDGNSGKYFVVFDRAV